MANYNFTLIDAVSPWSAGALFAVRGYYDLNGVGLVNGDTITATNIIAPDGVEIFETWVTFPRLDTNATPTGTFNLGDAVVANRFIASAPLGSTNTIAGTQLKAGINVPTVTANGVITSGAGYRYTGTTNSSLVMTVNAAVATAATTGVVHLLVLYRCVGNA